MATVTVKSRNYTSAQIDFLHNFTRRLGEIVLSNDQSTNIGRNCYHKKWSKTAQVVKPEATIGRAINIVISYLILVC